MSALKIGLNLPCQLFIFEIEMPKMCTQVATPTFSKTAYAEIRHASSTNEIRDANVNLATSKFAARGVGRRLEL